jgi:membrane protein DedA with SNARE-associated domain
LKGIRSITLNSPEFLRPEAWAHLPPSLSFFGIALATWLAEDLTLIASASLWVRGDLSGLLVLAANVIGISSGDLLLYALGRLFGGALPRVPLVGRFFKPSAIEKGTRFFQRKGGKNLVLVARFVPGIRLPTYTAAGIFKAPFWPTAAVMVLSGLVWVPLQMLAVRGLGRHLSLWQTALAALIFFAFVAWFLQGFVQHEWRLRWIGLRRLAHFEFWPPWLFYLPLVPVYAWLAFKYDAWLLPSLADPGIEGGGLIGESKQAILQGLPDSSPHKLKQALFQGGRSDSGEAVMAWAKEQGLSLPLVLKPDLGQRGDGVRLLRDVTSVLVYAAEAQYAFVAQEYCPYEREAGLFYARPPWGGAAILFSITDKRFPEVLGDGVQTLAELILRHPRARWCARTFFARFEDQLDDVLTPGEHLRLVQGGNHSQGALFLNGARLASPALVASLDAIAQAIPGFYIGRFDVRFLDEESLMQGLNYKVVELNGAGSEATHIWDPDFKLSLAYRVLARQWRMLFEYGAWQRTYKGLQPMGVRDFLRRAWAYRQLSRRYPPAS